MKKLTFMPRRNSDSARRAAGSLLLAANVALVKLSSTCKNCAQRSRYASTCKGFRLPPTGSELWQGEESSTLVAMFSCMMLTAVSADGYFLLSSAVKAERYHFQKRHHQKRSSSRSCNGRLKTNHLTPSTCEGPPRQCAAVLPARPETRLWC